MTTFKCQYERRVDESIPQFYVALILFVFICVGCNARPARVTAPNIDAAKATASALEKYDKNGDQLLSTQELSTAPGLLAALNQGADKNSDGQLSSQELTDRIQSWSSSGNSMVFVPVIVKYKGQPVRNAEITFIPEEILSAELKSARGLTDDSGMARMFVADDDLPQQNRGLGAMYMGMYRVAIKDSANKLPASFGDGTTIGVEVAGDYRMTGLHVTLTDK